MRTRLMGAALASLCLSAGPGLAQDATPAAASHPETATAPNVVLLLIDDAGFSDLGVYGGEAHTPNIDALAARGAVFTNYHTSPLCSPSRAMLLTGVDNHRTGVSTIPETLPKAQEGKPGYSMHLDAGVQTVATRLKEVGYRTYMTGKWHLGHGAGDLPDSHGFDHSFTLDASGADNWEEKPYMPYYTSADWFEDGKPAHLPANFYSSDFLVSKMLSYLDRDKARREPFFAYVAFQAVHIPVQAPRELTAHYAGLYDQGWEALRTARWQKAQERGLIPQGAPLAPTHPKLRGWASLDAKQQAMYSKSMSVYAGMLEAMDQNVGRLVTYLKEHGQYDNTIFFVTSDNGPEPSNPLAQTGFETWMSQNGYNHDIETLGEKGSMNFIGPEWANAAGSPGNLFKFHSAEGGIRVPLIAAGPGITAGRQIRSNSFVTDVTPTVFDFAGLPADRWNTGVPLYGKSLKGVLGGTATETHPAEQPIGIEVGGNSALFKDDYKITKISLPWGDAHWRLYNLRVDPGEAHDLSHEDPQRFAAMQADYAVYAKEMGVLALPDDFDPHKQVAINALKVQLHRFGGVLTALFLLPVVLIIWWRRRARAGR